MTDYRKLLYLFFLLGPWLGMAQVQLGIQVIDQTSQETLPGVFVSLSNGDSTITKKGVTNFDGRISFNLPSGTYQIVAKSLGYKDYSHATEIRSSTSITIPLRVKAIITKEVTIQGEAPNTNLKSIDVGKIEMEMEDIKKLPALMGEVDVLKSLQLLPGVQSGGEGNSGLYVRGGGPDQNLVLLDEAPIYNTGHLFGFFSVFNSDAIEGVTLYKGGIPAQYGGRLSSVIDFDVKTPNMKKWHANGGLGLISSRLTVEGPIKKDTAAVLISGRRTYVDVLSRPFLEDGIPYFFHDLNAKAYWRINDKNQLYLQGYTGRDAVSFSFLDGRFTADILWGNNACSLIWKHSYSDSLFHQFSFHANDYRFETISTFDLVDTEASSKVNDVGAKWAWTWILHPKHEIVGGFEVGYHTFVPRKFDAQTNDDAGISLTAESPNEKKFALSESVFLHDEFEVSKRLLVNAGIRMSFFQQMGPYDEIFETENGIDTIPFSSGAVVRSFSGLEPRIFARYTVREDIVLKGAISRGMQYLHLLSLSGNNLPFDVWVPSSALVEPQSGTQYSLGYFQNFKQDLIKGSLEVYYRNMENQIEFDEEFVPTLNGELERDLVFGRGRSYGAEVLLRKDKGDLHGWIGYTWSKTDRIFDQINDGEVFPFKYDRRHDVSVVLTYELNKKWSFSTAWVYGTGQAITLPEARYLIEGSVVTKHGPRNGFRMPAYHRLDLSATLNNTGWKRGESSWIFSVYNAYNRRNAYIIYVDAEGDPAAGELSIIPRLVYIFPILPSVTWNFSF